MKHAVAMREGPALAILSAKTHIGSIQQQGAEGQLFGKTPLDLLLVVGHDFMTLGQNAE